MANMLDEMIEKLLENGGIETNVVLALKMKRLELGDDPTEDEARDAALEVLMEYMPPDSIEDAEDEDDEQEEDDENEDITLTESGKERMDKVKRMVQELLNKRQWNYAVRPVQDDLFIIEFGCTADNVTLRMRIDIESEPDSCRIAAYLPIAADKLYAYPLCRFLAGENYSKRFGTFKYDERDGEICYEYSVLTENGLCKEDFSKYLSAVIGSASLSYNEIRRYCAGKFSKEQIKEIIQSSEALIKNVKE